MVMSMKRLQAEKIVLVLEKTMNGKGLKNRLIYNSDVVKDFCSLF